MRKGTRERIRQEILNGLDFGPVEVKVDRIAHGLCVTIPEQTTGDGKKLPPITVRHKDPARLVRNTHKEILEALQG